MKNILLAALLLIAATAHTQTIPLVFRMDLKTEVRLAATDSTVQLSITVFPYTVHRVEASGQLYINYVDARLKDRRKYLGWSDGTQSYEGNTIFFNRDTTKCWIWTVDRYGQLYKMELFDWFADDYKNRKP